MFWGEEDSPCQELPPEMIDAVLSFADLWGKKHARLVCRRWRWIMDQPNSVLICFKLYQRMIKKESIEYLLKSKLHIDYLMVADFKASWPTMTYSRNKFPVIREIEFDSGNCEQTMITILQYGCAQTECLKLRWNCLSHVRLDILSRMLSGLKWDQMTEVNLQVTPDKHGDGIELIFKKATVPNLKILRVAVASDEGKDNSPWIKEMMSEFMSFIERHSKSLKHLGYMIRFGGAYGLNATNFPNIPSPFYSTKQQETIARTLKLESVEIVAGHFGTVVHLMPPCVSESEQLTKLSWYPEDSGDRNPISVKRLLPPRDTPNPLQLLIQRNQNTLAHLTTTLVGGPIEVDPFQLSWLESCQALRELTFIDSHNMYNFRVRLPTVTKLNMISDYSHKEDRSGHLSAWIVRTFPNLEIIHISITLAVMEENWLMTWLQNVLQLPSLREIRFMSSSEHSHLIAENLLRQFCNDKPRLVLKSRKRNRSTHGFQSDLCLCQIKILPPQNDD